MSDDLAARLLEAQIAFTRRELLTPETYHRLVVDEIEAFLDEAARMTLGEMVTRDMIKNTAYKYSVQMPLEGSIPELVGEIAARIYRHPANDDIRVDEVLDADSFEQLVTTLAETDVAHRVVGEVLGSPLAVDACVDVVTHAVDRAVSRRDATPGAGVRARLVQRVTALSAPAVPALTAGVARVTRVGARYVLDSAARDTALVDTARQLWRERSRDSVGWLRELVSAADVEDIVVVIFEFWKTFRDTEYFRTMLFEGVDHVFDKYGDIPLADLLLDLGVGRADMIEEALRFGPPVMARLDERGLLEAQLRRQYERFYASPEFRTALDSIHD